MAENYTIENKGAADMHKKDASKWELGIAVAGFGVTLALSAIITFAFGLKSYAVRKIQNGAPKNAIYSKLIIGGSAVALGLATCGFIADIINSTTDVTVLIFSAIPPLVAVAINLAVLLVRVRGAIKVKKK